MAITTDTWKVNADGDWDTAADWSLGTVPDSNNNVVINTASIHTITHNSGSDTVNNLSVGNDHFDMNGGTLAFVAGATFGLDYVQSAGLLTGAGTVSITGAGNLLGGGAQGTLAFQIGGTIQIGNYLLGGSDTLTNNATTNQTGGVTLGDATGVNATITNSSSGTYVIAGDYGVAQGATSATLVNAGTFTKSSGSGTSSVNVSVTDTGKISVASGTLQFNGPTNSFAGAISGAGQFAIGGGVSTIALGTTITASSFGIYNGAAVTLGGNLNYAKSFAMAQNSIIYLNSKTLTLSGPTLLTTSLGAPAISGSGTLATTGATTATGFTVGGLSTWNNSGVVTQNANNQIGDGGSNAATFTNLAAGTFNITNDTSLARGSAVTTVFNNSGLLAKTGGSATSVVDPNVVDTGKIAVASGTLEFRGANDSFAGTISGAGTFELGGGGTDSIASGTTMTVSNFSIHDGSTTVTLGGNLSYANAFTMAEGSTFSLNGHTLALTGAVNLYNDFGSPTINGGGALTTTAATSINGFTLGGSVSWTNSGTVTQSGSSQIGDGGSSGATFTNQTGATFNIVNDTNLAHGAALTSSFANAGTFAKTAGSGTSYVSVNFANTGTLTAATGTLYMQGYNDSFGGTISGAGAVTLGNGGLDTIAAGAAITVSNFSIHDGGTVVTLGGNLTYANAFTMAESSILNLNGHALALTGAVNLYNDFGTPTINGSGALTTSSTTSLNGFTLGGSVAWTNTGTITQVGTDQIGDAGTSAATFANKGTFNIANDTNLEHGAALTSSVANSGTFAKTAGNGTSYVDVNFTNTGTVSVATGTMEFRGPNDTLGGKITGAGGLVLGGGALDVISAGALISTGAFSLHDGSTTAQLAGNLTYANAFTMAESSVFNLNGHALTLSGAVNLYNDFGTPTINGSGTLATSGATSINGFTLGGSVTWTNTGTITEVGTFQVGDGGTAGATFTNAASGTFNIANNAGVNVGTASTSVFNNAGAFVKTGGGGTSVVNVAFNNTGTVTANAGTIVFDNSLTGVGTYTVGANGYLDLNASVSAGALKFSGVGGMLGIANVSTFNGSISGFVAGDTLDLTGQAVSTMSYTGTKLTVTLSNNTTKTLNFASAVTALEAVSDGAGGTDIIALPGPYALTTGKDIYAFASGANTVSATAATLNPGDSLSGGSGVDTLALSGGGSFDLSALAALSFDNVTVAAGSNYTLTAGNSDVAVGKQLSINAAALTKANSLNFSGSAATQGAFSITGGAGVDTIIGGGTTDAIIGHGGNDILTGGSGMNSYYFNTALNGTTNDPTITNFHVSSDVMDLSHNIFTALTAGALPTADFTTGSAATTTSQHIIYNSGTGALLYDSDGSGAAAAVQFATVSTGLSLTASNFTVL